VNCKVLLPAARGIDRYEHRENRGSPAAKGDQHGQPPLHRFAQLHKLGIEPHDLVLPLPLPDRREDADRLTPSSRAPVVATDVATLVATTEVDSRELALTLGDERSDRK
jgi:hypothetical protein